MSSAAPGSSPLLPAILLAAGGSARLGRPKQLLKIPAFGGAALIERMTGIADQAGFAPVFVVLGAHAEQIERSTDLSHCFLLKNDAWQEGIAGSLRIGLLALLEHAPGSSGALLLVCDQPALTVEHLDALTRAHLADPHIPIVSRYAGTAGVPAIIPEKMFPDLLTLTGDEGARAIFHRPGLQLHAVDFPGGEWDLDTVSDLDRVNSSL